MNKLVLSAVLALSVIASGAVATSSAYAKGPKVSKEDRAACKQQAGKDKKAFRKCIEEKKAAASGENKAQ